MCGLVAAFSKNLLTRDELIAIKELMVLTQLRGTDSTGLLYADMLYRREYHLDKEEGNFLDLTNNYPDNLIRLSANLMMGHCRWATKGEVTRENAHPYAFEKLIGMHNGTLKGKDFDPESKSLAKKDQGRTDSYLFFKKLNQVLKDKGEIKDVIKDMSWSDAYAMILWDRLNTVNFFRNVDRPLWIGVREANGTVLLSSEKRYLEFIQTSKFKLEITQVKANQLYTLNLKEVGSSKTPWTTSDLPRQTYTTTTYHGSSAWDDWDAWDEGNSFEWDKNLGRFLTRKEHRERQYASLHDVGEEDADQTSFAL